MKAPKKRIPVPKKPPKVEKGKGVYTAAERAKQKAALRGAKQQGGAAD